MQFKTHGYWGCSLKSKPHYFFYYYVPKRYDGLSYECIALDMAYGILR